MTQRNLCRVGLAVLLVLGACSNAQQAPQAQTSPPAALPPVGVHPSYVMQDGSIDYLELRRLYGEPNTNIVLNPRAFDVYQSTSRDTVKSTETELVFSAADAQWVLERRQGDTLYCSAMCGDSTFIRNIRSITTQGDTVVVSTYNGVLTDVIHYGWLHTERPMQYTEVEPTTQEFYPDDFVTVGGGLGGESGSSNDSESGSGGVQLSGAVSGKASLSMGFQTKITADLVVNPGGLWPPKFPYIDTFSIKVEGGPVLDFSASASANGSASKEWPLFDKSFTLGTITLGPVAVVPKLSLGATVTASADGQVELAAKAHAGLIFWAKVAYTNADGWAFTNGFTPEKSASISASGEANISVVGELTAGLFFAIYDLAGPYIEVTGTLGAEAKAKVSVEVTLEGKECTATLDARVYCGVSADLGAKLCVPVIENCFPDPPLSWNIFSYEKDLATFHYEVPPEKLLVCAGTAADGGQLCAAGQTMCSSGCKNLQTDTKNCGTCGTNCATKTGYESSTCSAGTCSCKCANGAACPNGKNIIGCDCGGGLTNCGSGCIDTASNRYNCGSCGRRCSTVTGDASSTCSGGVCSCHCSDGTACPDGKSASSCPVACKCSDGSLCPGGVRTSCPCYTGKEDCGKGCQDIFSDVNNCGACGVKCSAVTGGAPTSRCLKGRCTCNCADGSLCPNGDYGQCCAPGQTKCSDVCADLMQDNWNCGQCGRECPNYTGKPDSVCSGGECSCTCASGANCPDGTWWSCPEAQP